MSHIVEIASGLAIAAAAAGGALIVMPRTRPEIPPAPVVLELEPAPAPVQRAEPLRQKTEAERVDDLLTQLGAIAAEHKRLAGEIKAIAESERKK